MDDTAGRIALVTGAGRGIGRAIALGFATAGIDVAVIYRERRAAALEVGARIRALGRRAVALQADVSLAEDVHRMVGEVEGQLGGVDVLVNNAGIARVQHAADTTERDWDEVVNANLKSCFLVSQAVLPGMRARRWGRLIFLSSVAAQLGGVVGLHYAASKAGLIGLCHSYAAQLAKEAITSNAIAPALIETDMVTGDLKAKPDRLPVGRFGSVEEVAEVALMLVRNAFVTGQTISVNGGLYMTS